MQEFEEHDYKSKTNKSDLESFFLGVGVFFLVFIVAFLGYFGYRKLKMQVRENMDESNELTEYEYLHGKSEDDMKDLDDTESDGDIEEQDNSVFHEDTVYSDWEGMPPEKIKESYKTDGDVCVFYLDDKTGYRLFVTDAACGSRFYDFEKTTDGGYRWQVINEDPFDGQTGVAREMNFQNENEGTITLQSPGDGDSSRITMMTKDGGRTFQLEEEEKF